MSAIYNFSPRTTESKTNIVTIIGHTEVDWQEVRDEILSMAKRYYQTRSLALDRTTTLTGDGRDHYDIIPGGDSWNTELVGLLSIVRAESKFRKVGSRELAYSRFFLIFSIYKDSVENLGESTEHRDAFCEYAPQHGWVNRAL